MSLEELQKDWDSIKEPSVQNQLSNEQVKSIIKAKYRSFFNRSLILEILILSVFVYYIVLTVFRFDELDIIYLEILGAVSIIILGILIIIRSLKLLSAFRIGYLNYSHTIVLKKLARQKIRIQRFYFINIVLGFVLMVILIILNIKIYNEYNLVQSKNFWFTIIPSSLIFIVYLNRWFRKYYLAAIREAEELLKELD